MDYLVTPISSLDANGECTFTCNCYVGSCKEKSGPDICILRDSCSEYCADHDGCWNLVFGRGVARRITMQCTVDL